MSGGHFEYLYYKVEDAGRDLMRQNKTELQRAFGEHLLLVAQALHDSEWVLSGDYGDGDDEEAIKAVLGDKFESKALDVLLKDANKLIDKLNKYTL